MHGRMEVKILVVVVGREQVMHEWWVSLESVRSWIGNLSCCCKVGREQVRHEA